MTDVKIPFGDNASDTAVLLLLAAQELELDPSVVRTQPMQNRFSVPAEVAERAFPDSEDTDKDVAKPVDVAPEDKPVAKTAPTKKAVAKKAAAKKTAAPKKAATNRSDSK